jgi:hypothetical protein
LTERAPHVREDDVSVNGTVLHVTSPAPRVAWRHLVEADPDVLVTQTPAWLDCMSSAGGYVDASRLYETGDGRRFVLPLVRRGGHTGWPATLASLPPGWGFGGLVPGAAARPDEVAAVFADLAAIPSLRVRVRPNPLHADMWAAGRPPSAVSIRRRAHVLELRGGFARVWAGFSGPARTAVRRAKRMEVVVERDTSGRLLPIYHELFERSLERWADQQHEPRWLAHLRGRRRDPRHKLLAIAEGLGPRCRLWVAWVSGRPAAAILVLVGANAHYTRGVMDEVLAGPVRANDLLHASAIEEACEEGCRYYHMGETGPSSSLARFKERFGAESYPYAEYVVERLPLTPAGRQVRGAVKRMIGFRDAR